MRKRYLQSGSPLVCLFAFAIISQTLVSQTKVHATPEDFIYTYTPTIVNTIDVPGAGTGALQGTVAIGIDTAGDVAGTYIDSMGAYHGFECLANGTVSTFDVTGAGAVAGQGTIVTAIGSTGNIAGYTIGQSAGHLVNQGFVRATDGTITTFIGANGSGLGAVLGINSLGSVTGWDGWMEGGNGFIRAANGTYSIFAAPGNGEETLGIAINTAGTVAGKYRDSSNVSHGFVRAADGTTTTFDPPNLATTSTSNGNSGTIPTSIDTAGDIAGTYTDTNGVRHTFVRTASGAITTFDPPGTNTNPCVSTGMGKMLCGSGGVGIDDGMDVVGTYFDVNNVAAGFLRYGSTGAFVAVGASEAGTGAFQGTAFFAINSSGTIAGTYADSNSMLHGFTYSLPTIATTTTLTPVPTPNPSVFGEPLTLSATVTSGSGAPPNGEDVNFYFNTAPLRSAPLTNGAASDTVCCLAAGTYAVTANYAGDSKFVTSTSTPVSVVVDQASSTTTLKSSSNSSTFGQSVNLTATVSGQFGGLPTGSVAFSNGTTSLGSVVLSGSNQAVLTSAALPAGADSITATYGGDTNFAGSTSTAINQVVMDFTVAAGPSLQTVTAGQSGSASITVTPQNGFASTVALTCAVQPAGPTCSLSPTSVTPAGSAISSTLTVYTTASSATHRQKSSPFAPGAALAVALCFFGFKKQRRLQLILILAASITSLSLLNGCSSSPTVSTPQSAIYTVTVAATAMSTDTHTTTFILTVDK